MIKACQISVPFYATSWNPAELYVAAFFFVGVLILIWTVPEILMPPLRQRSQKSILFQP
jgi:hypothetical protein